MCVVDNILDFGPHRAAISLSYLDEVGSRDLYQMPTCFEVSNFKTRQSFEARITNIYDPSKFWIVTKHRELEVFQKYLFRFYYTNQVHYKVPKEKIALNLYCVAFVDNAYYRGVIVGFPQLYQQDEQEFYIYFIDYGMLGTTNMQNIYYISEECMKVPQFAIRATLAGICPVTNNWTTQEFVKFNQLVTDQVLVGVILYTDTKRQILGVHLGIENNNSVSLIHEALISQNCAKYFHVEEKNVRDTQNGPDQESKPKYPYLFPSHELLESGRVPNKLGDEEYGVQLMRHSIFSSSTLPPSCSVE